MQTLFVMESQTCVLLIDYTVIQILMQKQDS